MSYNYNYDPWGDSQTTGAADNSSSAQSGTDYDAYSTGRPGAGYSAPYEQQSGGYASNQAAYGYYDQNVPTTQHQFQDQLPPPSPSKTPPSGLNGFLRRNVPLFGATLDSVSGINLPFLDAMLQYVNRDLLVSKIFYFFFYSAFGSLFPLMGVYFKQLGMNPAQVGILTGIRPFIEIFSAPFWNSLADRFQKGKAMLLLSLLSWILFTYSLANIRPPASACVAFNDTDYVLYLPYSGNDLSNYDVNGALDEQQPQSNQASEPNVSGDGNQVHVNKTKEGKDEILADEETETDQRRRRRRRRRSVTPIAYPRRMAESIEQLEKRYNSFLEVGNIGDNPLNLIDDFEDIPRRRKKRQTEGEKEAESDEEHSDQSQEDEAEVRTATQESAEEESAESSGHESGNEDEAEEVSHRKDKEVNQQVKEESSSAQTTITATPVMVPTTDTTAIATNGASNKTRKVYKQRHKTPPTHIVGMSPITVEYAVNYNKEKHQQFVTPMFSTIVYKLDDIKEVFFLLLLLIALGEFFSAPALTLADSATLGYLGDKTDLYGRQRMFGSLSWAITLLFVGMALDNAKSFAEHPCGPHQRERSYAVCFMIFSLLMMCAFLTATQFRFSYAKRSASSNGVNKTLVTSTAGESQVVTTAVDGQVAAGAQFEDPYASTQPRSIFNTAPPINAPPPTLQQQKESKFEYLDKWKSAMFAQRTKELPEWLTVFRQFSNTLHLTYLFITWFLGCGVGLVFTFLFWHLQDIGGTPTLFGICSVINHISEILAYFFSFHFIKRFGHTKVLSVGIGCNVIRFLYVAFLTNPYYALPFELVQGITHAACFAACCSYINHVSKPELRASTQGVMQGLHHGVGRACGTLLGGYMINAIGSRASFCIYGLLSGLVLAGFLYVRKRALEMGANDVVKVDDNENLGGYGAPQGVPSAIPGTIVKTQNVD